jgi:hypothetical protein
MADQGGATLKIEDLDLYPTTPELKHKAALYVCSVSKDVTEASELLEALGLLDPQSSCNPLYHSEKMSKEAS